MAHLICVAFYYLLRVGEYTPASKRKRTIPFRVQDITFRTSDGKVIPRTAPLARLLTASEATIKIPNQKNGSKGQTIHNDCNGATTSPVKALARQVHHILSNGGAQDSPIYSYYDANRRCHSVRHSDINKAIRKAAKAIGLFLSLIHI